MLRSFSCTYFTTLTQRSALGLSVSANHAVTSYKGFAARDSMLRLIVRAPHSDVTGACCPVTRGCSRAAFRHSNQWLRFSYIKGYFSFQLMRSY